MAMPNQAVTSVRQLHLLHRGKEGVSLRFNRLRQQPSRAVAQHRREWIVDRLGLTQGNNSEVVPGLRTGG
jgi:hypothetical protein